jgi:hypothetical protein
MNIFKAWLRVSLPVLAALLLAGRVQAHTPAEEMAEAAADFVKLLTPAQKERGCFKWEDAERENWHFVPKVRLGVTVGSMDAAQRQAAWHLLATTLSARGLEKSTNIMSLETTLKEIEGPNGRMVRDPVLYYFSIFGTPSATGTWGWRVEGHHLSLNFTLVKGEFAGTPSFLGTNPAEVRSGPRQGLRILAAEEDLGRQVLNSLRPAQRTRALVSTNAPADILTTNRRRIAPLNPAGLPAADLDPEQLKLLQSLVAEYVNRHRPELATRDLEKIRAAGWAKVSFGWAGSWEPGKGQYYRVQGPTFLLEYDNTQNQANHIHTVWRDFQNDFGDDLLHQHYQESHTPH